MNFMFSVMNKFYLIVIFIIIILFSGLVQAQQGDWPRDLKLESGVLTIYQPQVDSMEKDIVGFRAAMSFKATGADEPVFGAAWLESRFQTDRENRTVTLVSLTVKDARFPEGSEHVKGEFEQAIKTGLPNWDLTFSLDDLLTSLEASEEQIAAANDLKMDPPDIIYRDHPALLITINGDPVLRDIENSPYKAVINTPYPLIHDTRAGVYYLNAAKNVWYQAGKATGPYRFLANPPAEVAGMVDQSEIDDSDETVTADNAPEIVVSTVPAELVVTDGSADFVPLVGDLLVINNSESDIFMDVAGQRYYIVLSGRWYRAPAMKGPWTYVESDDLPAVFQDIPPESQQADSRVYVAGTDEAREAVMDAQIPQTAAVDRGRVDFDVTYDGEPKFTAISGTDLQYAVNTGSTVLKSGNRYYLVDDAVWYVGSTPKGPWDVADSRPETVDAIPPESPVYNVKYVYIYDSTPDVVYVGYTPGYVGSYVYRTTIVYGTGWYYRPWISPHYYYPYQATWGFHIGYNPWTGWNFGLSWGWGPFRAGFYTGGYWHHHQPWYGPHYRPWGVGGYRPRPVHFGDTNINVNIDNRRYSVRDNNLYRDKSQRANVRETRDSPMSRESRDRMASRDLAKDRGLTSNRAGSRDMATGANNAGNLSLSSKKNDVFADKDGNIFRNDNGNWQKREGGSWKDTSIAGGGGNARPATGGARPATQPALTKPAVTAPVTRPATRQLPSTSTRQSPAYSSSRSGYSRPSSLERQNYSRQRATSRNHQYSQHRSMPAGNRRR